MRRREFIMLIVGAAPAWPMGGRAQQGERVRRLGVFSGTVADDTDTKDRIAGFLQVLGQLGWTEGRNLSVQLRAGSGNAETMRKSAAELVAWAPDVILAQGGSS